MDVSREPLLEDVARHVYAREGLFGPGLQKEWQRLAGMEASEAVFLEAYQQYITNAPALYLQSPEQYAFLREHVFYGREYHEQAHLEQIRHGVEALSQMETLRPEVWEKLSWEQRLATLQEVENRLAEVEGRPQVEIVAAALGPYMNGLYNFRQIQLNGEHLCRHDVAHLVETVAHEGRHAYQHYVLWFPWMHPDPADVQSWRLNTQPGNYLTPLQYGYELYRNQPIEADAWAFGTAIREGLYTAGGTAR
jgi:hypothetical protein